MPTHLNLYEKLYWLERESNYTPLYKKYFYKKGKSVTNLFQIGKRLFDQHCALRAAHVNLMGADPTLGPIGTLCPTIRDELFITKI